jgi:hypothetical protein
MIHKNTDDLSDLRCIFNNHEHAVNKNKVSVLHKEHKWRKGWNVLEGNIVYRKNDS